MDASRGHFQGGIAYVNCGMRLVLTRPTSTKSGASEMPGGQALLRVPAEWGQRVRNIYHDEFREMSVGARGV